MKEVQMPKSEATDGDESQQAPVPRRASAMMGRFSMMMSLRNLATLGDGIDDGADYNDHDGGGDDDDDDDDDDFVFSDQMHQDVQREEFGLVPESETNILETSLEGSEKTPLLIERKTAAKKTEIAKRESRINAYNKGQKELFLEVLDEIDEIETRIRKKKKFRGRTFAFGLLNCLLVAYVFGAYPQHFWILYAVETTFWMTYKFRGMFYAKPLSEALYYLDFCWVMNVSGVIIISFLSVLESQFHILSMKVREVLFIACFGVFCGPVFMAAMVLPFVAFLFHDVNTMANLIIHLMPSMVMYHFRWHAVEITNAYPNVFHHLVPLTEKMNSVESKVELTRITLTVYFAWFTFYNIFMLLVGLKLPVISKDKGAPPPKYDTVFHVTWKGAPCELVGSKFWKRPKEVSRDMSERNDYEVRDFLVYMAGHALGSCSVGIILVGDILCLRGGKMVHATLLWITTILCCKRGADRYTYYVTKMYGQKVRKAFKKLEVRQQQELEMSSE